MLILYNYGLIRLRVNALSTMWLCLFLLSALLAFVSYIWNSAVSTGALTGASAPYYPLSLGSP